MNIKVIGSNQTELHLNNGDVVLFSYDTPVAARTTDDGFIRTSTKYSNTTSKHINNNWGGFCEKEVDQEVLDNLVK